MRAIRSLAAPAANGLIARIGRVGNCSAAIAAKLNSASAASAAYERRRVIGPPEETWARTMAAVSEADKATILRRGVRETLIDRHAGGLEWCAILLDFRPDDASQVFRRLMVRRYDECASCLKPFLHSRRVDCLSSCVVESL